MVVEEHCKIVSIGIGGLWAQKLAWDWLAQELDCDWCKGLISLVTTLIELRARGEGGRRRGVKRPA